MLLSEDLEELKFLLKSFSEGKKFREQENLENIQFSKN